jgi:hypothetical protein
MMNKYTIKEYNKVQRKIVVLLTNIRGVESVYTFGNVKAPGNSDIDWLIGIDNSYNVCDKVIDVFDSLNKDEKFMAYAHFPMIIDFSDMNLFNYIRYSGSLIHVGGKKIKFIEPSQEVILYQAVDLLIQYYPHNLKQIHLYGIREKYQLINAFQHIYKLVDRALDADLLVPNNILSIIKKNNLLRVNELSLNSSNELEIFFNEAVLKFLDFAHELKVMLSNHIEDNFITKTYNKENNFLYNTLFTTNLNLYSKMFSASGTLYENIFCEPSVFYYFFSSQDQLTNNLKRAVYKRNKVLHDYIEFNLIFNKNRVIYCPWWIKSTFKHNTFKNILCDNEDVQKIIKGL